MEILDIQYRYARIVEITFTNRKSKTMPENEPKHVILEIASGGCPGAIVCMIAEENIPRAALVAYMMAHQIAPSTLLAAGIMPEEYTMELLQEKIILIEPRSFPWEEIPITIIPEPILVPDCETKNNEFLLEIVTSTNLVSSPMYTISWHVGQPRPPNESSSPSINVGGLLLFKKHGTVVS